MKKKWFFVILILVIVAVVLTIVFINLFKERNTKALSEKLAAVTETGYLAAPTGDFEGSQQNKNLREYLTKLLDADGEFSDDAEENQKEVNKISNYLEVYDGFAIAIRFFSREMIFADASETYTNNRKKIENSLNKAQKEADEVEKYLKDNASKIGESQDWFAKTWDDCHAKVEDMFNQTANAVTRLADVYQASVPKFETGKGFLNNELTDIIFTEMKALTQNITDKVEENSTFGNSLLTFVDSYLSEDNERIILDFVYSEDLQNKAKDIKEKWDSSDFFPYFVDGNLAVASI